MATAVSKPSYPPKVKRPPPPFSQAGPNGVKRQPTSSSPQSSSKRLPDSAPSAPMNGSARGPNDVKNPAIKGPLGRPRREAQRLDDQSLRLQKPLMGNASMDNGRRSGKIAPEPYGEIVRCPLSAGRRCCPTSADRVALQSRPPPTSSGNTPSHHPPS